MKNEIKTEPMETNGTDAINSRGNDGGEKRSDKFVSPPPNPNILYQLFDIDL